MPLSRAAVKAVTSPSDLLFVADAMTGQDAIKSAGEFNRRVGVTGVVLTKLDGDARGGAALSMRAVTGRPIKLMGVGEKLEDLEPFHPERMAQRILGMGDITTLVEKAQAQFDEDQARKLEKKFRQNQFDFEDFKLQLEQIKKMGNLKDLMGMIPGVGKQIKDADIDDNAFVGIEAMNADELGEAALGVGELLGLDGDVRGLTARAAEGLMHMHGGVREGVALSSGAGAKYSVIPLVYLLVKS